jgi:hypothetical protein
MCGSLVDEGSTDPAIIRKIAGLLKKPKRIKKAKI